MKGGRAGVEAFCGSGLLRGSNGRRDSVWPIGQDLLLEVRHAYTLQFCFLT